MLTFLVLKIRYTSREQISTSISEGTESLSTESNHTMESAIHLLKTHCALHFAPIIWSMPTFLKNCS